jgi:DNA-directed RNA polymerase specialized sigma24 family protein
MTTSVPQPDFSGLQESLSLLRDPHASGQQKMQAITALADSAGDAMMPEREHAILALVQLAAGQDSLPELKNRAMEELLPVIQEAARRAASRFERRWREELLAEAPLIIWAKLDRFDSTRGRFQAFCSTVLYHEFVNFVRKAARYEAAGVADRDDCREREAPDDDEADEAAKSHRQGRPRARPAEVKRDDWTAEIAKCHHRRTRIREVLDRIACKPGNDGQVYLYAVLLMRLRQSMPVLAGKDDGDPAARACTLSELIENWLLPWRAWEEKQRFKPGLPTLLAIWKTLRPIVDGPPHSVVSADLCKCVAALTPGRTGPSPSCWNRWVHRAKNCARKKISPEDWDELFAPLLPDSSRFAGPEEGEIQ